MTIDIGHNCVECHEDTQFGSGRFVNRIPAENDEHNGYLCVDCQSDNCDECDTLTHEYHHDDDGNFLCEDCYMDKLKKGLTSDSYDLLEDEDE